MQIAPLPVERVCGGRSDKALAGQVAISSRSERDNGASRDSLGGAVQHVAMLHHMSGLCTFTGPCTQSCNFNVPENSVL